jgi:hypothetical protein
VKELRQELDALRAPQIGVDFESASSIAGQLKDAQDKVQQKRAEVASPAKRIGMGLWDVLRGRDPDAVFLDSNYDVQRGEKNIASLQGRQAEKESDARRTESMKVNQGEHAARLDEIRRQFNERAGQAMGNPEELARLTGAKSGAERKLRDDWGSDYDPNNPTIKYQQDKINARYDEKIGDARGNPKQLAEIEKERDLATEEENLRAMAQERELAMQERIVAIKKDGLDVAIRTAQASLDAASEGMKAARGPEERGAAQLKIDAAKLELENAERTTAEKREQASIESRIAELTGGELQKKQEALEIERGGLRNDFARATAEDKPGIFAKLAQNAAEQRTNAYEMANAGAEDTRLGVDAANPGQTIAERRARMQAAIDEQMARATNNKNLNGGDPDQGAHIGAAIADAKAQLDEFNRGLDVQLESAKAVTAELDAQAGGHATLAELLKTQAEYAERIAEARKDGNDALVAELTNQQAAATATQAEETFLKGPKGRLAEEKDARDLKHAKDTLAARARDVAAGRGDPHDPMRHSGLLPSLTHHEIAKHAAAAAGARADINPPDQAHGVQEMHVATLNVGALKAGSIELQ